MSMDLSVKNFSTEPHRFEAGIHPVAKAVKIAAENIPAHAPVVLNDEGKLALLTAENKASVYGLTPDSVIQDEEGPVYLTGEFFADSLILPEGMSAADIEVDLRKIGIFLK